jgi:hypothetical protein
VCKGERIKESKESKMAARVHISLYNLIVELEADNAYPDQMTDMANRTLNLFQNAVLTAKETGIDITEMALLELDDDDDDY